MRNWGWGQTELLATMRTLPYSKLDFIRFVCFCFCILQAASSEACYLGKSLFLKWLQRGSLGELMVLFGISFLDHLF